jgi:hypothetical protein
VTEVTNFTARVILPPADSRKPDSAPGSMLCLLAFWSFGLLVPLRVLRKEAA